MGGDAWVESTEGHGSTFYFSGLFGKQTRQRFHEYYTRVDIAGKRVLICDDNKTARQIFTETLQDLRFRVDAVESGQEAIQILERDDDPPFDLLLLDWRMPGMDGLQTIEKIRGNSKIKHQPVTIMVSAFSDYELLEKARQHGIDVVLHKPVPYSTLFDGIMRAIGKQMETAMHKDVLSLESKADLTPIQGARILLTEDNEINQQVASELLESAGFLVDLANDGSEAISILNDEYDSGGYDLVFMDLLMPVLDGYSATREMRKNPRFAELPVIAMTADAMSGIKEKCLEAGMNDYITKPLDPQSVFRVMVEWIKPQKRSDTYTPIVAMKEETVQVTLPDLEGFDTRLGLLRVNANVKLYKNLLLKFLESNESAVDDIRGNYNSGDKETAIRIAHTLKGVAGNLGHEILQEEAAKVEQELKNNPLADLDMLLGNLENVLSPALKEISRWKKVLEDGKPNDSSSSVSGEVDMELLRELCSELEDLLKSDDFEASYKIEEIIGMPGIHGFAGPLKQMIKKIKKYDFEAALEDFYQFKMEAFKNEMQMNGD